MRPTHRTLRISKSFEESLQDFPNAGPHPNITGMKKMYWGLDALCIACGNYVYHVDKVTYDKHA